MVNVKAELKISVSYKWLGNIFLVFGYNERSATKPGLYNTIFTHLFKSIKCILEHECILISAFSTQTPNTVYWLRLDILVNMFLQGVNQFYRELKVSRSMTEVSNPGPVAPGVLYHLITTLS